MKRDNFVSLSFFFLPPLHLSFFLFHLLHFLLYLFLLAVLVSQLWVKVVKGLHAPPAFYSPPE